MTIQPLLKSRLPKDQANLSNFWTFRQTYQANFTASMAELDREKITKTELAHYSILRSKPWRAYQLACQYKGKPTLLAFESNAIEKQLLRESVSNNQIGKLALTMLALASTMTALLGLMVIAQVAAPAMVLVATATLSMTAQSLAYSAVIAGATTAVASYFGAKQLSECAEYGQAILSAFPTYEATSADDLLSSLNAAK